MMTGREGRGERERKGAQSRLVGGCREMPREEEEERLLKEQGTAYYTYRGDAGVL